jgi:hypothetical protein
MLHSPDGRHNLAFTMYADHQEKIEAFITALARCSDPNNLVVQRVKAEEVDLDLNMLTDEEVKYIEKEVSNRHNYY